MNSCINTSINQQFFTAYLKQNVTDMATILQSPTLQFDFKSFLDFRSTYIGPITTTSNISAIQGNNTIEQLIFNCSIFHAALLTNSPTIIDDIVTQLDITINIQNIPHEQIDLIKEINSIYYLGLKGYNCILDAIVDATEKGHYESIIHLIEKYQLEPTIPIYHNDNSTSTNLFYYSTFSKSTQLIEYLLPLCFSLTDEAYIPSVIFNLAENGHYNIIKLLSNEEYQINLLELRLDGTNLLFPAVKSGNIELIAYLITIGVDPNYKSDDSTTPLECVQHNKNWSLMNHLITKHHVHYNEDIPIKTLQHSLSDPEITTTDIDLIINTFQLTKNQVIDALPLFHAISNCTFDVFTHFINVYGVDVLTHDDTNANLFHHLIYFRTFYCPRSIEDDLRIMDYLYQAGVDMMNDVNGFGETPIQVCNGMIPVHIIKWLIDHGAKVDKVVKLINQAVSQSNWSLVQYCLETMKYGNNDIDYDEMSYQAIIQDPSLDFITYLFQTKKFSTASMNRMSVINYVIIYSPRLHLSVIELLLNHGHEAYGSCCIDLVRYETDTGPEDVYEWFKCFDFLQDKYNYSLESYLEESEYDSMPTLIQFMHNCRIKSLSTNIIQDCELFHQLIKYRALVYRYKANINDEHCDTQCTIFHYLAQEHHIGLIQFTLLHSHQKPNLFPINSTGQTFLHALLAPKVADDDYDYYYDDDLIEYDEDGERIDTGDNKDNGDDDDLSNDLENLMVDLVKAFE